VGEIVPADPDAPRAVVQRETASLTLIVFSLGPSFYALEAHHVRHIGPARPPLPVPTAPLHILGVLHERGTIITVLDLERIVGAGAAVNIVPGARLMVLDLIGLQVGLIVDRILGVHDVSISEIRPLEAEAASSDRALWRGRTQAPRPALILDGNGFKNVLEKLVRSPHSMVP